MTSQPPKRAAVGQAPAGQAVLPGSAAAPVVAEPGAGALPPPVGAPAQASPQRHGRVAAAGTPVPGTGAASTSRGAAPVRVRAPRTPAAAVGASPVAAAGLQAMTAAMSEAELEEHVRELCKGLGIVRIHVYNSRGTTPGVPDDILVGPRGILWRELKTMRGKVTPAQQAMGEALTAAGQDWAVWRPADLLSWRIVRELVELSGRPLAMDGRIPAPEARDGAA